MKSVVIALVVVVVVALVAWRINGCRSGPKTLEEKLAVVEECGLKLAKPFTMNDLLRCADRKEYEKPGFGMVVTGLGMTEEEEPRRVYCANLWCLDTECIYGDGDYKRIGERMAEMTQGSLQLGNVQDHVDCENRDVWVSFTLNGRQIRIDCRVEDDWVDPAFFSRFVDLLKEADASKIYIIYSEQSTGQDCVIGCVTKAEFEQLKRYGVGFEPLE